jgi:putative ABC transport system permease protein
MGLDKFSWREIYSRPLRVFLTFLSISIGVGAVVAVLLATSTTRRAQRDMLKAVSGRADIEIIAGGTGFSYSVLKEVETIANVRSAVPGLNRFAVLFTPQDRKARAQVLGIDPRIDQQVRDYTIVDGQRPTTLRQLMLDQSFAASLDLKVGDAVKLLTKSGMQNFTVAGFVSPSSGSAVVLSSSVYLVLPAAQQAFQTDDRIDQIQVVVQDKSRLEQTLQQLAQVLPEGVTARATRRQSDMAQEVMFAPQNGLLMAVAFAIIIAIFIIYNTFQMAVGERRKQLGILRAIGATPGQIHRMILREAIGVSIAGCIAGCFAGVYGAGLLNRATEAILQVSLPGVSLQFWPFVVAIVIGIGVSLLGAIIPARSAAAVHPMEAIRAAPPPSRQMYFPFSASLSLAAVAIGLVLIWLAGNGVALGLDVAGVILILLGFVLMIPRLLGPACRILTNALEPWIGVPARLATKQLMRHVGRTSMTVGVLFVAIATCIGMAGNVLDNVRNVENWYNQAIVGDYFVRASLPDFATGSAADLPPEIENRVRQVPGIDHVQPMRLVSIESGEDSLLLIARDFQDNSPEFFDLVEGDSKRIFQNLADGEVVIGSVLAMRRQLSVGDSIELKTGAGSLQRNIVGVNNDYLGGGLTVYMDRTVAADLLGVEGIDALIIRAKPGQLDSVGAELRAICGEQGLILQSYAELVNLIDGMVNGVVGSLWMLLALGCAIAAMGLVNTLTMNILEQTREIGMLRVVAMTRQQVRSMIFAQALFLGILGIIPGAIVGIFVQFAIGLSSNVVLGHEISFYFRPGLFLGAAGIGLLLVLLSSLIPAERAARLRMASALHYE